jgi:RimJ/RimL family protein N-acetyltransferase
MNIKSHKLTIKKLSQNNFQLYALLVMNEEVMKYITGHALSSEEAEIRFQKAIDAGKKSDVAGFYIVRNKANKEFIGVTKLVQFANNQYEVGYMLLPEHWGRGYATAMVNSMIKLAKGKKVGELIAIVDPENPASIKVLTKFGFTLYNTGEIDGLASAYYKLEIDE